MGAEVLKFVQNAFLTSFPIGTALRVFQSLETDFIILYQVIPVDSCDYFYRVSIKTNVATDDGNRQNEISH